MMASYGASRRSVVLRALQGMTQKTRYGRRRGPVARINRPKRGGYPMSFTREPGYRFGPPMRKARRRY